jgi:hypothetical protein
VLAFWVFLQGRAVAADAAQVVARIDLNAPGCCSLVELSEQIARRSGRIALEPSARPGRVGRGKEGMTAEIRDLGAGRREVLLSVVPEAGQPFVRRLVAQSCQEAIEALALLIVLALDPDALTPLASAKASRPPARASQHGSAAAKAPRQPSTAQEFLPSTDRAAEVAVPDGSESAAPANDAFAPAADAAAVDSPQSAAAPATLAVPQAPASSSAPPKVAVDRPASRETRLVSRASWHPLLIAGAGGLGATGIAPNVMLGGSAFAVFGWDRNSLWSPSIGVGVAHAERNGLDVRGGTASFAWTTAQVEACPVALGMHHRLGARVCGLLLAGVLTAQGSQTLAPQTQRRMFNLFGASVALTYEPGWRVVLQATGVLAIPQQRYAYQFDPAVFYRVAPVSASVGLAVGLRFY